MFNKYYQPSKKVSWPGLIILIVAFLAMGSALSWLYLWLNRVCGVVIINIMAAIGFGALMGLLGRIIIKKCKLHTPAAVTIGLIIGIAGMTYVKWAMYDYYDYKMVAEQYDEYISSSDFDSDLKDAIRKKESEMKMSTAYDYFGLDYDFNEENYTFDENWDYVQTNAYDDAYYYYNVQLSDDIANYFTAAEIEEMKDSTIYEFYGYEDVLGKTKDECKANLAVSKDKNAYQYIEDLGMDVDSFVSEYYYGVTEDTNLYEEFEFEVPSMVKILSHPATLWANIKDINEEGRWSYTSSSSSYSGSTTTNSEAVKGVMLWIVWISELLVIDLCAFFIAQSQVKQIFIEMDNDWAQVYDSNKFTFANMSKMQLKSMLEQNADNIMNLTPIDPVKLVGRPYVKLTISHSKDYSENYLNGYNMTYNAKNRNYVNTPAFTGLIITPKQAGMLFSIFGIQPMGRIADDPEFMNWRSSGGNMGGGNGYAQPGVSPQPAAQNAGAMNAAVTTCGSCGVQVPSGKKFCPNCGAPFENAQAEDKSFDKISFEAWRNAGGSGSTSSDEMDGISTDDIDTTNL